MYVYFISFVVVVLVVVVSKAKAKAVRISNNNNIKIQINLKEQLLLSDYEVDENIQNIQDSKVYYQVDVDLSRRRQVIA